MTDAIDVRAGVLTVSDSAARGERPGDRSGDLAAERLAGLPATVGWRRSVADESTAIRAAVLAATGGCDLVVVTGGTGLGQRDVTPQTVAPLLDYEVPGLAEVMRARGLLATPHAILSRQLAGVRGRTLVLVVPGSPAAVAECLDAVWPALPHALRILRGDVAHASAPPAPGAAA